MEKVTCQRIVTRADLSMTMADKFLKDMAAEIKNLDNASVIGAQDSNISAGSFNHTAARLAWPQSRTASAWACSSE